MLLSFRRSHLSIVEFPDIEVPDFTLITGENGTGKTHLLQAIQQGSIACDIAPNPAVDTRYFEWTNFVPTDGGGFSSESLRNEKDNIKNQYFQLRSQPDFSENILGPARNSGLTGPALADISKIANLTLDNLIDILGDIDAARTALANIQQGVRHLENSLMQRFDSPTQIMLRGMAERLEKNLASFTENDFNVYTFPTWGRAELFQQSFGRLFVMYRDAKLQNDIIELRYQRGDQSTPPLSNEKFLETYGPAPWDFVNTIISNANLDFYINEPDQSGFSSFIPQLRKLKTNTQINFQSLSSGEKVLISFAFCVYYASDRRQLAVYPKLILLDEVDAPLHPSMSKNMIDTIANTLVGKFNLHVIATTHSPSTVALSPDNSIFTMRKNVVGLTEATKAQALNLLTVGVPTISVSYSGRRQVFVESPSDAITYEKLYRLMKTTTYITSDRSLDFIATGSRSASGEEKNTGCSNVIRLVSDLAQAGNMSVFGVLDWDGNNKSSDRIVVLAEGSRNGLENVLLDPLLVCVLICREFGAHKASIGINIGVSYKQLLGLDRDSLCKIVHIFSEKVFNGSPQSIISGKYANGLEIECDARCHQYDDHDYEGLILKAFPFLHAVVRQQFGAGRLMQRIVETVLEDDPGLIPWPAVDIMRELLSRPAHS